MTDSEKETLRKRIVERLSLEVSNLMCDPNDFLGDLNAEEFTFIKSRLVISLSVCEAGK